MPKPCLSRRHALAHLALLPWGATALAQEPASRAFGGTPFTATAAVHGHTLKLNGAGVRYRALVPIYAAALYLPQYAATPEAIVETQGAKRLAVLISRDFSVQMLSNMFTQGIIANNPSHQITTLLQSLAHMGEAFARIKGLRAGDMFSMDCVPGRGAVLLFRGAEQPEPFDEAFFHALLQIWLGPQPADAALKQALLGTDPYAQRSHPMGLNPS